MLNMILPRLASCEGSGGGNRAGLRRPCEAGGVGKSESVRGVVVVKLSMASSSLIGVGRRRRRMYTS